MEDLGILHGFQQFLIFLLAPHHDGAKQGRRRGSRSISGHHLVLGRPLDHVPVVVTSRTCLGDVSWHILGYFDSEMWFDIQCFTNFTAACGTICREAPRCEFVTKIPSLPLVLLRYRSLRDSPRCMTTGQDRNRYRFKY